MYRILSIDGGGIRGVYPARFLHWYETQRGAPLQRFFDLIVGTSTGGIIALALACGIEMEKVAALYDKERARIFTLRRMNPKALRASKYSNAGLLQLLRDTFGRNGSDGKFLRLEDAAAPVCIPSINVVTGRVKVFRTARGPADRDHDGRKFVWEVAACTSAAPTYFPTFRPAGEKASYADGGLWANDPALVGIEEALARGNRLEEIEVLSIGTGSPVFETESDHTFGGAISWRPYLVDLAFATQAQGVDRVMERLCGARRVRVDEPLGSKKPLDDLSVIGQLTDLATDRAAKEAAKLIPQFFTRLRLGA